MTHSLRAMLSATLEDVVTSPLDETQDASMSDDIIVAEERAEAEAELRMTEEAIDVLEETEESLDEITAKMEELVENDEVTEEAVMFLNMALNVTMRNAGVDSVIAGTESFGDHKAALKAGLEAAEESKEGVIAAIKKFFADLWDRVVNWYKTTFTAVGRMRKSILKLKSVELKGAPTESELDIGEKVSFLMVNGEVSRNPAADLKTLAEEVKRAVKLPAYGNLLLDFGLRKIEWAEATTINDTHAIVDSRENVANALRKLEVYFDIGRSEHGVPMIGQVAWTSGSGKAVGEDGYIHLTRPNPVAYKKGTTIKALNASELGEFLDAMVGLADVLMLANGRIPDLKKILKEIEKSADDALSRIKETAGKDKNTASDFKTLAKAVRFLIKNTPKAINGISHHAFYVLSAAYSYALACQKNLKEA